MTVCLAISLLEQPGGGREGVQCCCVRADKVGVQLCSKALSSGTLVVQSGVVD